MPKRPRGERRIAIIGLGGTVFMARDQTTGALKPNGNLEDVICFTLDIPHPHVSDPYRDTYGFYELCNKDSTNLNPTHWAELALTIARIHGQYDGIMVVHGTDTMAYTAGAVALVLGRQLRIPVVFTGAQLPPYRPGSDARSNLEWALETINVAYEQNIWEVMIVFSDRVLRASRATKVSEANFRAFDSPAFPPLGTITARGFEFIPQAFGQESPRDDDDPPQTTALDVQPIFERNILSVELSPGLDPKLILHIIKSWQCRGLLLKSFGAGNVPCEGEYSLIPVIEQAIKDRIPVLVATKFVGGRTQMDWYEPAKHALDAKAIFTGDMTDVMAQVKLMWALGKGANSHDGLKQLIQTDVVGEITP